MRRSARSRSSIAEKVAWPTGGPAGSGPLAAALGDPQERLPAILVPGRHPPLLAVLVRRLDLALGPLQLLAQVAGVQLLRRVGLLDQDQCPVAAHLQVALGLGEADEVVLGLVQPQLGGVEHGQQRRVVGEDPDRAGGGAGGQQLHVARPHGALGAEDLDRELLVGHGLGLVALGLGLVALGLGLAALLGLAVLGLAALLGLLLLLARAAGLGHHVVDRALEEEDPLRDVVVLA